MPSASFKSVAFRILAVALMLLVGGSLVGAAVLWHTSAIPALSATPCHDCSAIYMSGHIIDANVCTLSASPESLRDQLVRVRGTFVHDSCYTSLRDDSCPDDYVRVGLSRDITACAGAQKALAIQTGFGQWYDGPPVGVTVLGRLREIQNQKSCNLNQLGLDVLCLESVTPMYDVIESRVKYAIGRIFDLIFGASKT
jgi:hypothetical protein